MHWESWHAFNSPVQFSRMGIHWPALFYMYIYTYLKRHLPVCMCACTVYVCVYVTNYLHVHVHVSTLTSTHNKLSLPFHRLQRSDILSLLLTPAPSEARKRLPSHSNPDLATSIREEVGKSLRQNKGQWPCYYFSHLTTFTLPTGQWRLYIVHVYITYMMCIYIYTYIISV